MNIKVARKLHERRWRSSPVMTTGELLNLIGSEGIREALDRRWIVPDNDTGFLTLNIDGGKLAELESACVCACGKVECNCTALAESVQMTSMPMRETFAAFGVTRPGITNSGGQNMQAPMTPRSQTPTTPASTDTNTPRMGDPAVVEHGGQTYTGEISGFESDGRIRLRWKGSKPPEDRAYGPNEFLIPDKSHA